MSVTGLPGRLKQAFPALEMTRETTLVLVKTVIAGTAAWTLATHVFYATYGTFAAFTAMLLMHHTIAESVEKAVHYTAAVLVGIAVVGAVVLPAGPLLWLFPVILIVTLLVGRWQRLGSQGFNVTVAAVFAYGVFAMPDAGRSPLILLRDLAGMVLLGALVAVVTNLLIAPPLRYRSAADAVDGYCETTTQLLQDMVAGLREEAPDGNAARDWQRRADELPRAAAQTRSSIDHAWETSKLNPRRLLVREHSTFGGYRVTVHGVERIAEQLRSVTAGLVRVAGEHDNSADDDNSGEDDDGAPQASPRGQFLRDYADLLTAVCHTVASAGAIHTVGDLRRGEPLADEAENCRSALQTLGGAADSQRLDLPDRWAIYGALYTDAQRLCEEVQWLREALGEAARTLR